MQTRTLGRWVGLAVGALGLGGWIIAFSVAMDMSSTSFRTIIFFVMMLIATSRSFYGVRLSWSREKRNCNK